MMRNLMTREIRALAMALLAGSTGLEWSGALRAADLEPARLERLDALASPPELQSLELETVQERYPSRKIKVERQVVRDASGDFVNHGTWQKWNEQGQLMGGGRYDHGERTGTWTRHFQAGEAPLLNGAWGKMFTAPFTSTAVFSAGQLHGTWSIVDAKRRPVCAWQYDQGARHGQSVWYFPTGQRYREATYVDGQMDGKFSEWSADGRLVTEELYVDGRRLGRQIEYYDDQAKRAEAEYLFARETVRAEEDWWAGISKFRVVSRHGLDMKHGHYVTWFSNGQKAMEGEFREDQPVGKFVWWHPNGNRAIEGEYLAGKQGGQWSWWHENGRRFIQGSYRDGVQFGAWTWFSDAGELIAASQYTGLATELAADDSRPRSVLVGETVPAPIADPIGELGPTLQPASPRVPKTGPLLLASSGERAPRSASQGSPQMNSYPQTNAAEEPNSGSLPPPTSEPSTGDAAPAGTPDGDDETPGFRPTIRAARSPRR